jgi:hypothetical protein
MLFRTKKADGDSGDWVDGVAEAIEGAIDQIRDKAVVPLTTVARGVVYGTLALFIGTAALILFAIAFVRVLVIYINNISWLPDGVWLPYMVAGAIFVILGLLSWTKLRNHVKNTAK